MDKPVFLGAYALMALASVVCASLQPASATVVEEQAAMISHVALAAISWAPLDAAPL